MLQLTRKQPSVEHNYMSELMSPSWVAVPIENADGELIASKPIRYDIFVLSLFKKEDTEKMLAHATRGIADEAGEINSCVKKHLDYKQELDLENLIEELGDMRFYMQAIQNLYGISDTVILQANAKKLAKRYKNLEYTDEQAKFRRDKNEE